MPKHIATVLLATTDPSVAATIPEDQFQILEASTTLGIARALLQKPILIVADLDAIPEAGNVSRQVILSAFESLAAQSAAVIVTSTEFLAGREQRLGEALMAGGERTGIHYLTPRVAIFTNFCGGVGKTTLSLALAGAFRKATGLPAALVEAGVGASSFDARIGKHNSLYDIVTQGSEAQRWRDVDVYPSDTWGAEMLAADGRVQAALQQICHNHTLTVADTFPTNPLWKYLLELASDVIVVAASRPDALAQTEAILQRLNEETASLNPRPHVHVILNQVRTLGERIAAGQVAASVNFNEHRADQLVGTLAEPLLGLLYPGWTQKR